MQKFFPVTFGVSRPSILFPRGNQLSVCKRTVLCAFQRRGARNLSKLKLIAIIIFIFFGWFGFAGHKTAGTIICSGFAFPNRACRQAYGAKCCTVSHHLVTWLPEPITMTRNEYIVPGVKPVTRQHRLMRIRKRCRLHRAVVQRRVFRDIRPRVCSHRQVQAEFP